MQSMIDISTESSVYPTLATVTNPYLMKLGNISIVGFSGQNTDDLMRNTNLEDPLDALENILKYSHLSPTSPDTLGCFPYKDKDPFVMEEMPHCMFTANQKEFSQRLV